MKYKLSLVIFMVLTLSACASYQQDMGSSVPNQNDVPLSTTMPPMPDANIQVN